MSLMQTISATQLPHILLVWEVLNHINRSDFVSELAGFSFKAKYCTQRGVGRLENKIFILVVIKATPCEFRSPLDNVKATRKTTIATRIAVIPQPAKWLLYAIRLYLMISLCKRLSSMSRNKRWQFLLSYLFKVAMSMFSCLYIVRVKYLEVFNCNENLAVVFWELNRFWKYI